MKKYTQRELHNEAFRDMLKGMGSSIGGGIGRVAKAIPGAALRSVKNLGKDIVKHISPDLYDMSKSAIAIYKGSLPGVEVLKDYIKKSRSVTVYLRDVKEQDIINGNVEPIFKDTYKHTSVAYGSYGVPAQRVVDEKKNANKVRLTFNRAGRGVDLADDITKIPFTASSKDYIAYIDKIDKDKQQILAIKEA